MEILRLAGPSHLIRQRRPTEYADLVEAKPACSHHKPRVHAGACSTGFRPRYARCGRAAPKCRPARRSPLLREPPAASHAAGARSPAGARGPRRRRRRKPTPPRTRPSRRFPTRLSFGANQIKALEQAIADGATTDEELRTIPEFLETLRAAILEQKAVLKPKLQDMRERLAKLGPAPKTDGPKESAEIAAQRQAPGGGCRGHRRQAEAGRYPVRARRPADRRRQRQAPRALHRIPVRPGAEFLFQRAAGGVRACSAAIQAAVRRRRRLGRQRLVQGQSRISF